MFENIMRFFKKRNKNDQKVITNSREAAKERLHLVLMQDRANVSADFLELMKQEIIEVIKKYIDVDESAIDVRLTNKENEDGTNGAPALYANIPILNIKNEARKIDNKNKETENKEKTEGNKKPENTNNKHNETKNESKKENKNNNQTNNKEQTKSENKENIENKANSKKEIKQENTSQKNNEKEIKQERAKEKIKSEN